MLGEPDDGEEELDTLAAGTSPDFEVCTTANLLIDQSLAINVRGRFERYVAILLEPFLVIVEVLLHLLVGHTVAVGRRGSAPSSGTL